MVKMSEGQIRAVLGALDMPVLLLLASNAGRRLPGIEELARDCIGDIVVSEIQGSHHFHMEESVDIVAQHIMQFLERGSGAA